jgi:alcohol dehydrogenase (cytochrome c)
LQQKRNDLSVAALLSAAGILAAAVAAHAQSANGDWPSFGRDGSNQRFAPFAVIDRGNAARLAPAWTYPLGTVGSAPTHPIVIGGVMYVGMAGNDVAALDATTGREIWRYRHVAKRRLPQIPSNRGVAVAGGRVFEATDDARVIALDQATGKVIWDKAVAAYDASALVPNGAKKPDVDFQFRAAPLVLDGRVIVGATGFEANRFDDAFVKASLDAGIDVGKAWIDANLGRRAFLAALDAETGAEVWRWYTTKEDGWEGSFATTSPDGTPLNRDIAAEKAAASLYKNAWAAGSNSTWMTPAHDAASGLIFIGTGNPAPGDVDLVRPGDNLYANGVAALDARTGAVRWFFQESPHGQYDATGQAVLFDATVDGRAVPAVLECGKSGWCFAIERANGKLLFRSDEVVPHINPYAVPAPEGIRVSPGGGGAVSVSPVSYDPGSGVAYVAARHAPVIQSRASIPNVPGGPALFKTITKPVPAAETWGTLTALDMKNGGRLLWQVKTPQPLVGGTFATAGGLVFTGEPNGKFNAYDAATGAVLWSTDTGAGVGAPPMSYVVDGRQFVEVATGRPAGEPPSRPGGAIACSRSLPRKSRGPGAARLLLAYALNRSWRRTPRGTSAPRAA